MSESLNLDVLWALLADRRYGVLATLRRSGRPQLSNIGYVYDADKRELRFLAATFRAKTRNLMRDPRASVHVSSLDFHTWVVAEGDVTVSTPAVGPGEEVYEEGLDFYRAMGSPTTPEYLELYPLVGRALIKMTVERIYGGEGSAALGINSDQSAST